MVWPASRWSKTMVDPEPAEPNSARSVPLEPSSAALVTVKVLRTMRSSSASSLGVERAGRRPITARRFLSERRDCCANACNQLRSEKRDMLRLLRYGDIGNVSVGHTPHRGARAGRAVREPVANRAALDREAVCDTKKTPSIPAQTERRGLAGPVSALLGGENSPAAGLETKGNFRDRGYSGMTATSEGPCLAAPGGFRVTVFCLSPPSRRAAGGSSPAAPASVRRVNSASP